MFYFWNNGAPEMGFESVGQVITKAVDGRDVIEYYKPYTFELVLQYRGPTWKPFKYFTIDGKVFEFDSTQSMLYADRSFGMHDVHGKWTSGVVSTKFTPISPEEAAEKAVYFLNLNPGDPWPLSRGNAYWDGKEWCGGNENSLVWDENDDLIMIPFSEIKEVLKSFKVTK